MRTFRTLAICGAILGLVTGCGTFGAKPEKARLAAALTLQEAQAQFTQAAALFDAACGRPASQLSGSELAMCADWVKAVGAYKVAYPAAVAALESQASGDSLTTAIRTLLVVKNQIVQLLVLRGVTPATTGD